MEGVGLWRRDNVKGGAIRGGVMGGRVIRGVGGRWVYMGGSGVQMVCMGGRGGGAGGAVGL